MDAKVHDCINERYSKRNVKSDLIVLDSASEGTKAIVIQHLLSKGSDFFKKKL